MNSTQVHPWKNQIEAIDRLQLLVQLQTVIRLRSLRKLTPPRKPKHTTVSGSIRHTRPQYGTSPWSKHFRQWVRAAEGKKWIAADNRWWQWRWFVKVTVIRLLHITEICNLMGHTGADTGQNGADTGQTRGRRGADRGRHRADAGQTRGRPGQTRGRPGADRGRHRGRHDGALSLAIMSRILMHNAEELAQQPWMDSMLAPI